MNAQISSLELEMVMTYHSLTVFEDDVICSADRSSDYGDSSVMLMMFNKLSPSVRSASLIRDHLTDAPSILRVMHGGLQVAGQYS